MTETTNKKRLVEDRFDICPSGLQLCFDRELFLRDEFNVDKFVMRQKKIVSLEVLHDDLMQYFNILKNSLVELINQDYADFVNLSTNLVGLDKVITSIDVPIAKLKLDIEIVQTNINKVLDEINQRVGLLKDLDAKRQLIHSIESVHRCIIRLEKWLNIETEDSKLMSDTQGDFDLSDIENDPHEDMGLKLERVGNEFSKLEYFTRKCLQHTLIDVMKSRIITITSELQCKLEAYLIESVKQKNKKSTQQALRTYLSINKVSVAEKIYQERFVRVALQNSTVSNINPESDCINYYKELLTFTDTMISDMMNTTIDDSKNSYEISSEFDFLINSIFPEIIDTIINANPQFFSPGNPDSFHERYSQSMKYLQHMEDRCSSLKQWESLRSSSSYKQFVNKWSVPIYFQIRYQEISGNVEKLASENSLIFTEKDINSDWQLSLVHSVHESINQCWKPNVYMPVIRHRLWRLNLQLLNFLLKYIQSFDWSQLKTNNNNLPANENLTKSDFIVSSRLSLLVDLYRLLHISELTSLSEANQNELGLVWIYNDLVRPTTFDETENDLLSVEQIDLLKHVLGEVNAQFIEVIYTNVDSIQAHISDQCCQSIKSVFDIPRQYRRTNKPWPTKPSQYVTAIFRPIIKFSDDHQALLNDDLKFLIFKRCLNKVTSNYQDQIKELLLSVRKMEDSLKKLKRTRGIIEENQSNPSTPVSSSSSNVTDDDKIRKQVSLDAEEYMLKCSELLGPSHDVQEELGDLVKNVEDMCNTVST